MPKIQNDYCKQQVNCTGCLFHEKGCQILNHQLQSSERTWLSRVATTHKLHMDQSFILNQMLLYILAFAERKKTIQSIQANDIENFCLAGEDTYLIDCLWLCIQYGEIAPARILSNYLYEKYGPYIIKISRSLNDHIYCSPDEILQRVYLAFTKKEYNALTRFKGENSGFKTYLTIITKKQISECLRKRQPECLSECPENTVDQLEKEQLDHPPDHLLIHQEFIRFLSDVIVNTINQMPPKKMIDIKIMQWRMQGQSFQSIASRLGEKKTNTISHRYQRIKQRLINSIQQQLKTKYQTDFNDLDPDDIYLSINNILKKRIHGNQQETSL
ncbi:MAG: sigma-70 family RNA polymerase sigma factor [Candidatus Magnetomorum sp.]|nr:sigma-70 family RNA polymerase sigma factor [Candidatus Magnetomorum sp.]